MAYTFRNAGAFKRTLIDKVLSRMEQIAITKTVNELLFTGYDDLLLKLAVELKLTDLPYEKFAFFYAVNINLYFVTVCLCQKHLAII